MFESIKNFFNGTFWYGFSTSEAVDSGTYRIFFKQSSIGGVFANILNSLNAIVNKTFTIGGYEYTPYSVEKNDATGQIIIYSDVVKTSQAQAGISWGVIIGGIAVVAAILSIERVEKLMDSATVHAIQITFLIVTILLVWKFSRGKK